MRAALGQACERFGWQVLAYSVLSNHFHLCLATPEGNLSDGMRWLQGTYAARFNRMRGEVGRLFQGRFKSLGKNEADIKNSRKTARWKLAIAARMKRQTSVTNQWMSEHLHMGSPNGVSSACGKYEREIQKSCKFAKQLRNLRNEQ